MALLLGVGAAATADESSVFNPYELPGAPSDWSHRHQVFSAPRSLDEMRHIQAEPRFWHQVYGRVHVPPRRPLKPVAAENAGLWGEAIPSATVMGTVGPGQYPAKYSFNGPVSCSDYVAFNTSLAGGAGSTAVTFTNASSTGGTIVITNSYTGAVLTLTAGTNNTVSTWTNNSATGSSDATNFNTVLNAAGSAVGVYSTASGSTVTITASQLGAVNTISIKNNSVSNISSPASGGTSNLAGGVNSARILAYNNLYGAPCGAPTVSWQYETGGDVKTSVSLSSDGTQLAFVQSYNTGSATTGAELVLLKPGTSGTLAIPTLATAASYRTCGAPCMAVFPLENDDTNSSPFVDYSGDIIYIGDSSGVLYKFTGVFKGTPAEVTTSPWPITVSAKILTSPVYDTSTSNVFIADSGGFLYSYKAATGAQVGESSQLAASTGKGIVDAPLVDSTANTVYVFVGQDGNTVATDSCTSTAGCNGVFRFTTTGFTTNGTGSTCASTDKKTWTSGTNCGAESVFGVGSATTIIYDGAFDNAYLGSTGGTAGNLWTCAATGTLAPKLASSSMTSFGSVVSVATNVINPLTSAAASCSPVTEIFNGTDQIYLSVSANGSQTVCTGAGNAGACLYRFTLTTTPTAAASGRLVSGGTSGIVIDNTATGGGSQVYFTYLSAASSTNPCPSPGTASTGGCAVQASQAGLN